MNNTDFFKIRTISLKPVSNRIATKEAAVQKPRPTPTNTSRGIQSLLEGSSKSHCNTFVGYSRIPHKYDHFHEKTFPNSAAGSFIHSLSPKRQEPQKDLILLSESLDVNQAKIFFHKQQIYQKVFDVARFSRKGKRPKKL